MNSVYKRLERVQKIYDLSLDLTRDGRSQQVVCLALNHRVVHPPKPDPNGYQSQAAMAARMNQVSIGGRTVEPEPEPKGRWLATIGKFWGSDDDPEKATMDLERRLIETVTTEVDDGLRRARVALAERETLARLIEKATERQSKGTEE
mgnify:CR=1 FL=1